MPDIPLLIPDLPSAQDLLPWLERIDSARWYTNFGPLVRELEATLAAHWPLPPQVVTLNTGTAPLELAMAALDLAAGGKVLMPAFSFPATAAAALRNGLVPQFADVAPHHWQLTPALARQAARQQRLALVMPVATFGSPVAVAEWDAFADDTGIPVLIDAAGAFGNQGIGERAAVAFSFHATKPFGIGEGGALVTRDAALARRVRRLSNFGFAQGLAQEAGGNAKMSEYAAAVGLAQWPRWLAGRAARASRWNAWRAELAALPGVALQQGYGPGQAPSNLVLQLALPAQPVLEQLAAAGIASRRWYCPPLQRHPAFARFAPDAAALPVTARLASHTLGVPWFARITAAQCQAVGAALASALAPVAVP